MVPGRVAETNYLVFLGSGAAVTAAARMWRFFSFSVLFSDLVQVFPTALLSLAIALPTVVSPNKSAIDNASNFMLNLPEGWNLHTSSLGNACEFSVKYLR